MFIKKDPSRPYKLTVSLIITVLLDISVKMKFGFIDFLDTVMIGGVQHGQSGFEDKLFTIISFLASPKMDIVWIILLAFFLWGCRYKIPAFWALCLLFGGDAFGTIVKHIVARPRPSLHLAADDGYSFPSGHVLGTFLVVSVIWIVLVPVLKNSTNAWMIKTLLGLWLFLVMVSRVYLNAHFPTDVIGGAFFAYTWLQIAEYLYLWVAPKLKEFKLFHNSLD